jgi:mono/diheme cytochrome c family protein
MIRRTLGLVLIVVGMVGGTPSAGGWAVVSVDTLPHVFEAGVPFALTFSVRQHGVQLVGGLSPTVEAVSGSTVLRSTATGTSESGRYQARLELPQAGDWTITIDSGFGANSRLKLLPIAAVRPPANAAAVAPSPELGRRLFVAKGCVTCHQNSAGSGNMSIGIGPALIPQKYQAAFLARILADPAGTLPHRDGQPAQMPNLGLRPAEIDSLVAFINAPNVTASR